MTAAITIHFRNAELTHRCVDSLMADGWSPILVWDNSADGGTSAQQLQRRYVTEDKVWFAPNRLNLGFGKGMNAALIELFKRGYAGPVLLVNNDAEVRPGMREAMLAELPGDQMSALVAPRLIQDGREQGWLYYQPWLALVTPRPIPGSFAYLSGCCLLVQRPDNAQSLFDEDFFMYGEDVELSWRMRKQGALLALLDEGFLAHEGSASSGVASAAYEHFLVRSHWTLADKLANNAASKKIMQTLRVPSLLARAFLRSWRYLSWTPMRALLRAHRGE